MQKIGLIGGLATRAGIFYYEEIQKRLSARRQPFELVLNHADVSRVLPFVGAGDREGLGSYLGSLANDLAAAGCKIVAITAVAPHMAISQVAAVARVPVADVLKVVPTGLAEAGVERVAIFGNRAAITTNVFGAARDESIVRLEEVEIEWIHSTYNEIALHGKRGTGPEIRAISALAHRLMETRGAQAILLAGTDLSSFYADQKPDFPFIDVAQCHIDQIIRLASRT